MIRNFQRLVMLLLSKRGQLVEAKRSYKVRVNHMLNGSDMMVGYYRKEKNEVHFFFSNRHDAYTLQNIYGTSNLENLWPLIKVVDHGHYSSLFIALDNPKISWVGSGGYWNRADINQVK
jgi:hypothetical protein